jgi:hypothetical protein
LIQEADGDTLFLDEVGDMPPPLQARLLSVLDERELLPVGATKAVRVGVRVVAATHADLLARVREGRFRDGWPRQRDRPAGTARRRAGRVVARGPAAAVPARRALESDPGGAPARPVAHDGLPAHEALGPAGAREVPAWISRECRTG